MSFGDRPASSASKPPVPYYLKDDSSPAAKPRKRDELVGELDAMKAAAKLLDPLPGGAVKRILSWLADRYGFALVAVDEVQAPLGLNRDTEPMPPLERNPVQVVPWTPPGLGQAVCNSLPAWGE